METRFFVFCKKKRLKTGSGIETCSLMVTQRNFFHEIQLNLDLTKIDQEIEAKHL